MFAHFVFGPASDLLIFYASLDISLCENVKIIIAIFKSIQIYTNLIFSFLDFFQDAHFKFFLTTKILGFCFSFMVYLEDLSFLEILLLTEKC